MKNNLRTIKVVAAIIKDNDKILATKRGHGEFIGGWEFPGGKIEKGETKEEALKREIQEELSLDIAINNYIYTVEYDYKTFHLTMDCFICSIKSGELTLNEHSDCKWLTKDELDKVDWLPADVDLIQFLKKNWSLLI